MANCNIYQKIIVTIHFIDITIVYMNVARKNERMNRINSKNKTKNSPYKILAVRTECRLFKESGNKAMVLNVIDVLLFQCTFTVSVTDVDLILLLFTHVIVSHFDRLVLVLLSRFT